MPFDKVLRFLVSRVVFGRNYCQFYMYVRRCTFIYYESILYDFSLDFQF